MNRLLVAIAGSLTLALPVLAQSPCFITDVGTDLQLANDDTAQGLPLGFSFAYAGVSYTSICVCSNGYIWFGPSSPAGGETNPTVGDLITGAPRLCALWNDFDPSNFRSGHVFYRTIPASGTTPARAVISWANVVEWFGANRVSMQVVLDSTGEFSITYGANPAAGNYLVPDMIVGMSSGVAGATYPHEPREPTSVRPQRLLGGLDSILRESWLAILRNQPAVHPDEPRLPRPGRRLRHE